LQSLLFGIPEAENNNLSAASGAAVVLKSGVADSLVAVKLLPRHQDQVGGTQAGSTLSN